VDPMRSSSRRIAQRAPFCEYHAPPSVIGMFAQIQKSAMRFVCGKPPLTIYTSDFTINNMTGSVPSAAPLVIQPSKTTQGPFVTVPLLTLVLPNATVVSHLATTSSMSAATTVLASTPGDKGESQARNNGETRKWVESDKMKFRLVFILWPTLIGLTMAL
jgi:hypothetical protein